MEHLSVELLEIVSQQLNTKDIYSCLTVNRFWYSICIKYLYSDIKPTDDRHLKKILRSFSLYPRFMDTGKYIKGIDMSYLSPTDQLYTNDEDNDFIHALTYCPNLERLTIGFQPNVIRGILSPRMPELKKLMILDSGFYSSTRNGTDAMQCFYKFRASLTNLNLKYCRDTLSNLTLDEFTNYLESFPLLTSLDISVPISFRSFPMFEIILQHCPQLSHLKFQSNALNISTQTHQVYPNMKHLELTIDQHSLRNIHHIKTMFPGLTSLIIRRCCDRVDCEWNVILKVIMQIKTLTDFKMEFDLFYEGNYNTFWKSAQLFVQYPYVKNRAIFLLSDNNYDNMELSFTKNTRTITLSLSNETSLLNLLEKYLSKIGQYLDTLEIYYHSMNPVIHRERIYRLCPNISVLNISDHGKFTSNPSTAPNYNIKGLTLEETRIHSLLFKDIQACYPMLQELKLISNHDIVSTGNVYQLPETGLKRLILEYRSPVNRHMMVVKEVDGKTIKSWHYNYQSGDIKVTEGVNVADVVRQLSSEGLLLFKSTSIDSVLFTMH